MTNFDFLQTENSFDAFASVALAAEQVRHNDIKESITRCRQALEIAVKWMYSVDCSLVKPYQDHFQTLISADEFQNLVGVDLKRRIEFIRKMDHLVTRTRKKVTEEQADLCLENLFIFLDFVAHCYGESNAERQFDPSLLKQEQADVALSHDLDISLDTLMDENKALKAEGCFSTRREKRQKTYIPKPLALSEYQTRKIYIDTMLLDANWVEGKNWRNEVELTGMPNASGIGFADYVLYGDDHKPLAVIEAKSTCTDVSKGRHQAKLYADLLKTKHHPRPVIFLTNGFDTHIDDGQYPERKVATIYSKRDLEKLNNLKRTRASLQLATVDPNIAGRYYQIGAIKAVCDAFEQGNRRKALLVMATGSGKTRTVIALCKILLDQGWVSNILFLADRNSLITQAKRNFTNLLPDLTVSNLCEDTPNYQAHGIFSTYQTMMNVIDSAKDKEGKIFTNGHFDLVICDEAHRSIYNKYKDIFTYFDAPLVGLTATPIAEIDRNTYDIFLLEKGMPTYGYELAQAVKDGFLVDFLSVETSLKFIEQGIVYDGLSDDEKEEYEKTFKNEDGDLPESMSSAALNSWIFNRDTIVKALHILMDQGLHINYGETLGKTIIFAKNHKHAEKILEVFGDEYPHLQGYAKVIDNYMTYAQSAIDDFSRADQLPQIAISVDMLDTGIDVPEILNLVFFKTVMSKAKFWQMIGRGTRLCPGLVDGKQKEQFYIFDFCGNFEFFRMNKGKASANMLALQGAIFNLKMQMISKLQHLEFQTEDLIAYRERLISEVSTKVGELNRSHFAIRQHLKYVDLYEDPVNYGTVTYEDTRNIAEELAPLILPDEDEICAVRFDALMYGIEVAHLIGNAYSRARKDLLKRVSEIARVANIPEVMMQAALIDTILHTSHLDHAGIGEFEHIREKLRNLMKYIPKSSVVYETDFQDDILSMEWKESELENDDLRNYKAKAESYIRNHQDNETIVKLRSNRPLTTSDIQELERILWCEVGTEEDYNSEYRQMPLGEFVRGIVGLDMHAAKAAFADYLDSTKLDSRQIYFVNQIVEYIVHIGLMKDLSVLQGSPFTDQGSISDIFSDLSMWERIHKVITQINSNAVA